MSIASSSISEAAIADTATAGIGTKVPPKRRTLARADSVLLPEPR